MAIPVRGYAGPRPRPPLRAGPGGWSFPTRSLTCPAAKPFFEACAPWWPGRQPSRLWWFNSETALAVINKRRRSANRALFHA